MTLVPVGELKPRAFYLESSEQERRMLIEIDGPVVWYLCKWHNRFSIHTSNADALVTPMPPDCDSFDWQPPREPTALELAKHWLNLWSIFIGAAPGMREGFDRIIAAMERESKQ